MTKIWSGVRAKHVRDPGFNLQHQRGDDVNRLKICYELGFSQ